MTAAEQVAKGARLLDERMSFWWDLVDLEVLDLYSGYDCVIGQVFGEVRADYEPFVTGLRALDIFGRSGEHGFSADDAPAHELEELWRAEIQRRRAAPEPDCARCPHPPHHAGMCEAPAADDDGTCGCEETT